MTEVAGRAAFLIPRRPSDRLEAATWAVDAASIIDKINGLSSEERRAIVDKGVKNAERFNTQDALNRIEEIYLSIIGK